MQIVSSLPFLV